MREAPWFGNESLPLSMAQRDNAICYAFEKASTLAGIHDKLG